MKPYALSLSNMAKSNIIVTTGKWQKFTVEFAISFPAHFMAMFYFVYCLPVLCSPVCLWPELLKLTGNWQHVVAAGEK